MRHAHQGPAPVSHYHRHVADCPTEASDPRVSGTFRTTFNEDCYSMGIRYPCIIWGTNVLEDERGGWHCPYGGTDDMWGENGARVQAVCTGTGESDGLTYVYHQAFGGVQDFGDGTDIHGIIYVGPPRWGPAAEPPANSPIAPPRLSAMVAARPDNRRCPRREPHLHRSRHAYTDRDTLLVGSGPYRRHLVSDLRTAPVA